MEDTSSSVIALCYNVDDRTWYSNRWHQEVVVFYLQSWRGNPHKFDSKLVVDTILSSSFVCLMSSMVGGGDNFERGLGQQILTKYMFFPFFSTMSLEKLFPQLLLHQETAGVLLQHCMKSSPRTTTNKDRLQSLQWQCQLGMFETWALGNGKLGDCSSQEVSTNRNVVLLFRLKKSSISPYITENVYCKHFT